MDRYKFCGKRLDNGEWLESISIRYLQGGVQLGVVTGYNHEWISSEEIEWIEVVPSTVGQYTNQKDNDKTELYEKDIVRHVNAGWLGVIHFADGSYRIQTKHGT